MAIAKLFQQVQRFIKKHQMFAPTDRVLIAISGGPDSVALTALLLELQQQYWPQLDLTLAHLNHQLRAWESDRDEQFVIRLAEQLNLNLILERVAVAEAALGENLEATARQLRYQFLQRAAQQAQAGAIATGHNLNDQAETLLMRLLRGSGPQGLAGIFPVVQPALTREPTLQTRIVRPLLAISREQIERYLSERQLDCCHDSSNDSRDFTRNKIRHQLLPQLQEFNPRVIETLARTANLMRELCLQPQPPWPSIDTNIIDNCSPSRANKLKLPNGPESLAIFQLSATELANLPMALRHQQLRQAIIQTRGHLRRVGLVHIEAIESLLAGNKSGKRVLLPDGWEVAREFDAIIIRPQRQPVQLLPVQALQLDSNCQFDQFIVIFQTTSDTGWPLLKAAADYYGLVDLSRVGKRLLVRTRQAGDRYQPAGHQQREKLKNLMIENRIPITQRDSWPVVTTIDGRIVWCPGLPIAQSFAVDATTAHFAIILAKC